MHSLEEHEKEIYTIKWSPRPEKKLLLARYGCMVDTRQVWLILARYGCMVDTYAAVVRGVRVKACLVIVFCFSTPSRYRYSLGCSTRYSLGFAF